MLRTSVQIPPYDWTSDTLWSLSEICLLLIYEIKTGNKKMGKYDLVAPCGDYCGGCGQYKGLIIETAKQMREFADLYGFEFRAE